VQTLAAIGRGLIDNSLEGLSPQPTQEQSRPQSSADLSGLDNTMDKKMLASKNSQLNVPPLHDSVNSVFTLNP
jgi:hypothetical protein